MNTTKKSYSIRVPGDVYRDLQMLQATWSKTTFGQVLRELIKDRRLEIIKAIDIQVEESS